MTNSLLKSAYLASGCFWGTEYWFKRTKGIIATEVGYCGGTLEQPSYEEVSTGKTGHAETVKVDYNPQIISYKNILKLFFETHDPTQIDRQGPDIGTQYRSAIFYQDEDEKAIALDLIKILEATKLKVVTEISPFTKFWKAEDYHQSYYSKTGQIPYCHVYKKKF